MAIFKNKPKVFRYKNGATLIYKRRKMCEATAVQAGFWAGHYYMEDINGLPHFAEHMLFKGTKNRTENEIIQDETEITSIGAVTSDYSLFVEFFESNKKINQCFEFASDILLNTSLNEESIENEKKVVFEEKERAIDKVNKNIFIKQFRFMEKDFKLDEETRLGTKETLGKATLQDIQNFYDKHFVSDKFFISVASSLPIYKIKKLVKKYFINNLKTPNEPSQIIEFKKYLLEGDEGINIVKNSDKTISGLISIKFAVDDGEKYKHDYNLSCLTADMNTRADTFYNVARKEGLIYDCGVSVNYNSLSSIMTMDFHFTTSSIDNVDRLFDLIGDTISIYKKESISEELIEKHKEKAIISLDKSFPSKYLHTVNSLKNEWFRYKKFDNISKRQKIKFFKAVNLNSIKENIDLIFNKENKVYITFMGNCDKTNFKSLDEYKSKIFK